MLTDLVLRCNTLSACYNHFLIEHFSGGHKIWMGLSGFFGCSGFGGLHIVSLLGIYARLPGGFAHRKKER